jgi:1,4-alpha-glucan branching enzyme
VRNKVRIHYDNGGEFTAPRLWIWVSDGATQEKEILPAGKNDFGVYYDVEYNRSSFHFKFKDARGRKVIWEDDSLDRYFHLQLGGEIWTMADRHNVYNVLPARPRGHVRDYYARIKDLVYKENFYLPDTDVSGLSMTSMLGANILRDGSILFGFFHPRAARVYLAGNFNHWHCPGHPSPQEEEFMEMELYRGFYYQPNIWLKRIKPPEGLKQIEYKFFIQGGTAENERFSPDPYTRVFSDDFKQRNSVVVNPTTFQWTDQNWQTPAIHDLILYELNVYGFTDNDPAIPEEFQGTFKGVTQRIKEGFFDKLSVTALALMPTSEVPMKRGLGYEPCTFMAVEKDFGTPDDFREMINEAHRHGLAVIIDQVFNHTSNDFNPLWMLINDGSSQGGFYFAGETMWGNKVATGKDEVDNMLIDSCKMFIREYHVDGFRFDATHSYFLNHKLLHRLAHEIKDKGFKPDAILIAENLPNEEDLNLEGYNGYAQWSNIFHDKIKALLREGEFEGTDNSPDDLGTIFYFSKDSFAAHTNNVVNYCESHDENSVQFEVATGGAHLQDPWIKNRKARLGLMATLTALGQPMIYMGQEYGIERERNRIDVNWVKFPETHDFYYWTRGLLKLRRELGSLKLSGYDPIAEGKFTWVLGPWLEEKKGGGQRVIGWRAVNGSAAEQQAAEKIIVMFNFEDQDVPVDIDFGFPGKWQKLVDIENVANFPAEGRSEPETDIVTEGVFHNFILPSYSGFIYKWHPFS